MSEHDRDALQFAVWVINKLADAWHESTSQIYCRLQGLGIVDNYLLRHYDVLHTMGGEALVDEIEGLVKRGEAVA